jgi:hypothetical protein
VPLFENPSSSVTAAMKALLPIAAIRSTIFSLIHQLLHLEVSSNAPSQQEQNSFEGTGQKKAV